MNAREFKRKIKDRAQSSHDKAESLRRELQKDFPVESADEYRKIVRMTAALQFLPPVDCVKGFECIRKNTADADANEFLDYFEKTYIGLPRNFGSGRRSPRFEIKEWSVYNAVITKKNKTNNNVEVWNRIFNIAVNTKHPSIAKLIPQFKDSQKDAELKVEKINTGEDICSRKRKLEDLHQRIHVLVSSYESAKTDILSFFCGMSHNVAILSCNFKKLFICGLPIC